MAFRVQLRRDTSEKWTINNPILLDGEMGYETDTSYIKIGDGLSNWNTLKYWNSEVSYPILPVPEIKLHSGIYTGLQWFNNSSNTHGGEPIILSSIPSVTVMDIPNLIFNSKTLKVYLEMVIYRRKTKREKDKIKTAKSGYVIPSPHYLDPNDVRYPAWGKNFRSRSGDHDLAGVRMNIDKPNHYQITSNGQKIDISQYLNGRFSQFDIEYLSSSGGRNQHINLLAPLTGNNSFRSGLSFTGYSSNYTPLRVAFRYVIWDPEANSGKGDIISGPLSEVMVVRNKVFPFSLDYVRLGANGYKSYSIINNFNQYEMICTFS